MCVKGSTAAVCFFQFLASSIKSNFGSVNGPSCIQFLWYQPFINKAFLTFWRSSFFQNLSESKFIFWIFLWFVGIRLFRFNAQLNSPYFFIIDFEKCDVNLLHNFLSVFCHKNFVLELRFCFYAL